MQDLNNLIDSASGWVLSRASGINAFGQIVGQGTIGGNTHAFLLTPVPEPSSLFLLGIAFILAFAWRRMRRSK